MKYHYYNTVNLFLGVPNSWNFHATSTVIQKFLFIFWKLLSLRFVKVKFDGNIQNAKSDTEYVIRDSNGKLLVIGSFFFL